MAARKLKPIEERDPYAAAVLDAFDNMADREMKVAKYSERDNRGKAFIDCAECTRGGNGDDADKCSSGWRHKKGRKGGCFMGTLLPDLTLPEVSNDQ